MTAQEGSNFADESNVAIAERDAQLIRDTFFENDALLKVVRALMLGYDMSAPDKTAIRSTFANADLRRIMWKRFCPLLNRNDDIGSLSDIWLGVEAMVFGQPQSTVEQAIGYKEKAIEMTKLGLGLLENPDGEKPSIEYKPNQLDVLGVNLLGRNMYIRHIEKQLGLLKLIAAQTPAKPETKKEKAKRKEKDSNK